MSDNVDIFSLPGFQPLTASNQLDRVHAETDGSIDLVFYKDRPLDERTPIFNIYIGKEFGNNVRVYHDFNNNFVTSERDLHKGLKHYRLRVSPQQVKILPGTYVLRFFADSKEIGVKHLVVSNSLIQSPRLPPSFLT